MRLKDKIAIVTGASSGIGIGIAEVFAEEGARVVCVARREKEGRAVAVKINDAGGNARFLPRDVSVPQQVDRMVAETLEEFGRIDALVNNAGVNFVKPFDQITVEDWDRVINVDLRGTFLCTRACIDAFLRQGSGSVVNIATVHTMACLSHWRANIPAGRVGSVHEMGRAAAFLASDDASYITGANLLADGGMTSLLVSKETYRSKPQQRG